MGISKIDILNRKIGKSLFGYSRAEVDQLMQEVAEALGESAEARKDLFKKVKRLEVALDEYRKQDETLRDTLMSTQKMVDDLKASAGREAERIVEQARSKAEAMIQQGYRRLAQVHDEIESLKRQRTQFEVQLASLIESHMKLLEADKAERDRRDELESKVKYLAKAE